MRDTGEGTILPGRVRVQTRAAEKGYVDAIEVQAPARPDLRSYRPDPRSEPRDTIEMPAQRPSSPTLAVDLGVITEAIRQSEPPAPSERFPRTAVVLDALALADQMRLAAQTLKLLCGQAEKYEPTQLARNVRQVARALAVQIGKRCAS